MDGKCYYLGPSHAPNDNTLHAIVLVWVALGVLAKLLTLEMKVRDLNQFRVY